MKRLTRRQFLWKAGLAAAGLGALPRWAVAAALGPERGRRGKTLVVLFQRGAADGLNIVPPFLDPIYLRARPSIKIGKGALDLDSRFGLHPSLEPLLPLYKQGRMAVVIAAGSPDPTRSHFDAQDFMETGTPGVKATEDGWGSRCLETLPEAERAPLSGVAISPRLPRTLRGRFPALALSSADQLSAGGGLVQSFESVYDEAVDAALSGAARDLSEARSLARAVAKEDKNAAQDLGYPKARVGRDLHELARLIKAGVGLRFGFVEMGGWDHHVNEGGDKGQLARRLEELSGSIAAFYKELGDRADDVVLLTMTEFGRTIEENGDGGTDHGHASVMLAFGGKVRGGRVVGRWPGLAKEQLFEGRDLLVTTDYRRVVGEALRRHLGLRELSTVFPGFDWTAAGIY